MRCSLDYLALLPIFVFTARKYWWKCVLLVIYKIEVDRDNGVEWRNNNGECRLMTGTMMWSLELGEKQYWGVKT